MRRSPSAPASASTPPASSGRAAISSSVSAPRVRHSLRRLPPSSTATSPRWRLGMCSSSDCRERQRTGAFEGHLETDLAGMVAAVFERGDLERPLDAAEIRDDDLIGPHVAVEEYLPQARVRGLVLEHAGAGDRGAAHAGLAEELAPAPGRFGVR